MSSDTSHSRPAAIAAAILLVQNVQLITALANHGVLDRKAYEEARLGVQAATELLKLEFPEFPDLLEHALQQSENFEAAHQG